MTSAPRGDDGARERVVAAALALFREQGFERTTVEQIAARAGVGRTSFFRQVGSKEAVVFPDHDALVARVRERLDAADAAHGPVAVREAARLVLRHYLAEGDLARARYELTRSVAALRDREVSGQRAYHDVFVAAARRWDAERGDEAGAGALPGLHAELLAAAVVTAHNHVLRAWLRGATDRPEADLDVALDDVIARSWPARPPGVDAAQGSGTQVLVLRTDEDLVTLEPRLRAVLERAPDA